MMPKSGYMQVSNASAYNHLGMKSRIIEVAIGDSRYAIENSELSKLILYGRKCQVRSLIHYYGKHLRDVKGVVSLSYSKKGLIIDIFPERRYMASRNAIENLLKGYMNYTKISEIPVENRIYSLTNPTVQSSITPWVAV